MAPSFSLLLPCVCAAFFSLSESKILPRDSYPQIIAHRGASGYIPEHSLQAYQLAIDLKTDYIEPDLCLSKDGVFVALHDLLLDDVTNVDTLPRFSSKKTTKLVEGKNMTGYFVNDFTYAELQELHLKQRLPERTTLYNGLLKIPAFTSIMSLAQTNYATYGRTVGIYPELKHPGFFKDLGFPMEDLLLAALNGGGYEVFGDEVANDLTKVLPVVIQCFEAASLQYLRDKTKVPLILLLEAQAPEYWTADNMKTVSSFADAVGPEKTYFGNLPYADAVKTIDVIHSAGLKMHPWTFRADQDILKRFGTNFALELNYYYCCLGMDGLFSEFPDRSREALDAIGNYTLWKQPSQPKCSIDCASV